MAKKPKQVPLGEPLPPPDDSEFEFDAETIEEIKRSWGKYCPKGYEKLLDAE